MKLWCCNHIVDPARPTKGGPATCGFITRAQPLLNQGTRNNPLAIRLRNCVVRTSRTRRTKKNARPLLALRKKDFKNRNRHH
jgi:hypothetical protein